MSKKINTTEENLTQELIRDHENLLEIYDLWQENKDIEDVDLLQQNISTFIMDCRYAINRVSAKSRWKFLLRRKTILLMEAYMVFWSKALTEVKKTGVSFPKFIQNNYRFHYVEATYETENPNAITDVKLRNKRKYKPLGIFRNY